MKASFRLGSSQFNIDKRSAELSVAEPFQEERRLFVDVAADKDEVCASTEWGWWGYPPRFYLQGFPVPDLAAGADFEFHVSMNHSEYELALYFGEHNDVFDVVIKGKTWVSIEIIGRADVMGTMAPFRIAFGVEGEI